MRARNIKPGFFINEEVAALSVTARLLFIGLWCMADKNGFLEYRPKKIKVSIFPYDSFNLIKLLEEVSKQGLIIIWCDKDKNCHFIEIPNFKKHQRPHPKEKQSNLKEIVESSENLIKLHEIKCNFRLMLGMRNVDIRNNDKIPFSKIISYLNQKTNKKFKEVDSTLSLIKARIKDGFSEEDFYTVIDNQVASWGDDKKMSQYLRPSTLFQKTKMDGYLNNNSGQAGRGGTWI